MEKKSFTSLINYLSKIPGIDKSIQTGEYEENMWFVQFKIDTEHALAWHVIQEIGSVVNYLSIEERLPAVFYPISPAPYLNGGPNEYLQWIIETKNAAFKPEVLMQWLEGRLPQPVEDEDAWINDEEE